MIDTCRYSPEPQSDSGTRPRIALAHDWLVGYRGGEAVLEHIARVVQRRYEVAGVYTMFADAGWHDSFPRAPDGESGMRSVERVHTSFLNRLPGSKKLRRWMLPLYPRAVDDLSRQLAREHARQPVDLLISTSSAAIKGLRAPAGVKHICYCHAPARYLWSQAKQYATGRGGGLRSIGLKMFGPALRRWDRSTAGNVDIFMANSTHIAQEILRCYGRNPEVGVIFPPVRTEFFTREAGQERRGHWLYVGALEPYKQVGLVIRAAAACGARLHVVGTGSQRDFLREEARQATQDPEQIQFLEGLSDAELRSEYRSATLLVFPQVEDFGIVAVEAQACGLPVAAFRAGGALDSVVDHTTGVFFDTQTPEAIMGAAKRCSALGDMATACRANAERFSVERFETEFGRVIDRALSV